MAVPIDEVDVPFVSIDPARRAADGTDFGSAPWLVGTEIGLLVAHYEDALTILKDARWHTDRTVLAPEREPEFERWLSERQAGLLQMNGDDHRRLRRVVGPWLTPNRISGFRSLMRNTISDLLGAVPESGVCEFIGDISDPYATNVVFDLVGSTPDWRDRFVELSRGRRVNMGSPSAEIIEITTAFDHLVAELLADERPPRPDSLLAIIRSAHEQELVSWAEAIMLVQNVIGGATDSVLAQLGSAMVLFSRYDDQYQRLRNQPELVDTAVEEILRFRGAARGASRRAAEDIEYRDVLIPQGTRLTLGLVSANRDSRAFDNPRRFDIGRRETSHLSFGHGAHFCLGAALARAELGEALTAIAARARRIELVGDIEWRSALVDFWGPAKLPLRLITNVPAGYI